MPPSSGSLPDAPIAGPVVPPPAPWLLVLRAVIAVGLLAGWVHLAQTPAHRSLDDLLWALESGEVTSVTIERPPSGEYVGGTFPVEWEGRGRPGVTSYAYSTGDPEYGDPRVDQSLDIRRAAERSDVDVTFVGEPGLVGNTSGWQPAGIFAIVALLLLVGGPQPRLATKWAWFWLIVHVPPAALLFVVLEPLPLWQRRPVPARHGRLTGGKAFLLGLVASWLLTGLVPGYAGLFPS